MNHIILIGRLTRDPELTYTPSGKAVANARLAVDRGSTNPQGERETDFIDLVLWERRAETLANFKRKGDLIAVAGRLQVRTYEAKGGGGQRERAEVVVSEVRFLDNREAERGQAGHAQIQGARTPADGEEGGVPW